MTRLPACRLFFSIHRFGPIMQTRYHAHVRIHANPTMDAPPEANPDIGAGTHAGGRR